MNPVAKSRWQKRQNQSYRREFAPDPKTFSEITCKILKVWDRSDMESDWPERTKMFFEKFPGSIIAEVVVASGKVYVLPFDETPDQIYSTYGNAALLVGRSGKIKFRNQDINTGTIVPIRSSREKLIDTMMASDVPDIGIIWGM